MTTQPFSFRVLIPLLFLTFSFVALAPFAQAAISESVCYRYSYMEVYTADMNTLPPYVTVRKDVSPGGIYSAYLLDNASSKPLIVQYRDSYQTQLKLVDSKAYNNNESNATDWFWGGDNSLSTLVRIDSKVPSSDTFSSNAKPAALAPVRFSIAAQHNGQPVNITGTLSYTLLEHDCSTGKVVIADTVVTTPTASPTPLSFGQNLLFGMRMVIGWLDTIFSSFLSRIVF